MRGRKQMRERERGGLSKQRGTVVPLLLAPAACLNTSFATHPMPPPACLQGQNLVAELIYNCCFPSLRMYQVLQAALLVRNSAQAASAQAFAALCKERQQLPSLQQPQQQQPEQQQRLQQLTADVLQQTISVTSAFSSMTQWSRLAEGTVAAARSAQATGALGAASGCSTASREAAFDLLLELVVHDSACWQAAARELSASMHSLADLILQHTTTAQPPPPRAPGCAASVFPLSTASCCCCCWLLCMAAVS